MKFIVGNLWVRVEGEDDEILPLVHILRFFDPIAKHDPSYIYGDWDGYRYLYDHENRRFLSGMLRMVLEALEKDHGVIPDVVPYHSSPRFDIIDPELLAGITLRDYQVEAVQAALKATSGVIYIATGGGKTSVIAALAKTYAPMTCLVVVNSKLLLGQTAKALEGLLGESVGMVGDGQYTLGRVTVATVQTLHNLPEDDAVFDRVGVLFLDEAHHASAETFQSVLRVANAEYRFGLSGSPFKSRAMTRYEDWILLGLVGEVCYEVGTRTLVDRGILADPTVYFLDLSDVPRSREYTSWSKAYKTAIVTCAARNTAILDVADAMRESGLAPLILVQQIAHGDLLLKGLIERNAKCVFLKGGGKAKDYRGRLLNSADALDRYTARVYDCLVATTVLDEGIDVPSIDALLVVGGGKSNIKTIQRLGRALRPKPGSNTVPVVDLMDSHHNWFKAQSRERIGIYVDEGHEVLTLPLTALVSKFTKKEPLIE